MGKITRRGIVASGVTGVAAALATPALAQSDKRNGA